ncbi:unnamed protein product [Cochlearia groenlandica]
MGWLDHVHQGIDEKTGGGSKQRSLETGIVGEGEGKRWNSYGGGGKESDATSTTDQSRLVFFEKRKQFELEDLLKASAELLGKGRQGGADDGGGETVQRREPLFSLL